MSLYSALTQVLAHFAAKIKGIQTGYDGTEYDSPGEAVREQINDLHVLIGDEPGTAIQASAVAYNDSNVAAELTNVNGRLQQLLPTNLGESVTWTNGKAIKHADGAITSSSYYNATDYINISDINEIVYTRIVATLSNYPTNGMAFYNANKEYISGIPSDFNPAGAEPYLYKTVVPEGAVFARFSYFPETSERWSDVPFAVYDASEYAKKPFPKIEEIVKSHEIAIDELKDFEQGASNIIYKKNAIDHSGNNYSHYINVSNQWAGGGTCSIFAINEAAKMVSVVSNDTNGAIIAFLLTNPNTSGTVDYTEGTSRIVMSAGEEREINIPDDAVFLYVSKTVSSTVYTPESISWEISAVPIVDSTLSNDGEAADAYVTGVRFSNVNKIINKLIRSESIDLFSNTYAVFINTSSLWSASGTSSILAIPDKAMKVSVTGAEEHVTGIAFLTTNEHVANTAPNFVEGTGRIVVSAGSTDVFDIPDGANYLYVFKTYQGNDYSPESIEWVMLSASGAKTIPPLGLHEMPPTETALNIVKRCRQMTDIKWTPATDLARFMLVQTKGVLPETAETQNYLGTFKAGTEYKGIPYGRTSGNLNGYEYLTVGSYVDFGTFVSSVSNPKSRLCNANLGSVSGHKSVLYATVCSGMACYALNVTERSSSAIPNIPGLTFVGKVNDNGTFLADNMFKIGDVLNKYDYHVAIITDIIRDEEGAIQSVELSDASTAGLADRNYADGPIGGVCRRKGWTRTQLFAEGSWGDYSLYRYSGDVTYTPSQYVNVGDEFDGWKIEHFPIMPYEGEGFVYKSSYVPDNAVKLVINLEGYGYARVFKDGTEISGSPFAVTEGIDYINISTIDTGEYSAYLCNMEDGDVTNLTYPCSWKIV